MVRRKTARFRFVAQTTTLLFPPLNEEFALAAVSFAICAYTRFVCIPERLVLSIALPHVSGVVSVRHINLSPRLYAIRYHSNKGYEPRELPLLYSAMTPTGLAPVFRA
jgi:hypothetical protein